LLAVARSADHEREEAGMRRMIGAGLLTGMAFAAFPAHADSLPPSASYRPLPTIPFETVKANDEAEKPQVPQRQQQVLSDRYDLADHPIAGVMMSGNRKPVQGGVRVKLPAGVTWDSLAQMAPDDIRQRGLLPKGLCRFRMSSRRPAARCFPMMKSTRSARRRPQHSPFRCRFRSARSFHPGISAADLPHDPSGAGRRLPWQGQ
jgi:hypothetical protein